MEEMAPLWSNQESVDEMRHKLLCKSLELEQFKAGTIEELGKRNEYVCQLIHLLKNVSQERDEAIDQLQKLSSFPLIQNESPVLFEPTEVVNSSITESNSLSPVDSFLESVSSPEFSNINMVDSTNNVGYLPHQPMLFQDSGLRVSLEMPKVDHASLIMDDIIKGKPLPQKGKLLQAVVDAPPLLHSLLLAGPLPKWRNPPQIRMFHTPPFSMQKDEEVVQQKHVSNLKYIKMPTDHHKC